jgi:cathepsin O
MSSRKLSSESTYPLTLKDGTCRLQSSATGAQVASNYSCSELIGEEDKIVELLATHGPVTVAVDATNWQYYVGGVIQWNCDASVNHAVQIVGYDKTSTPHHYIVRNSWGSNFGDNGYLYIATNKNLCGIATEVVWLSVES